MEITKLVSTISLEIPFDSRATMMIFRKLEKQGKIQNLSVHSKSDIWQFFVSFN